MNIKRLSLDETNNYSLYDKHVHNTSHIVGFTMVEEEEWDKITYYTNKNEIQTTSTRKTRQNK